MSKYIERAEELRASTQVHYNCAQSVIVPFAEDLGVSEEEVMRFAVHFGGGMKMGSVCGAITGGLMALGLAGIDSPADANAFCRKIRENHGGLMNCRDLLRRNMEEGGEKKPHCDAMVYESVALVEEMMRQAGRCDHN